MTAGVKNIQKVLMVRFIGLMLLYTQVIQNNKEVSQMKTRKTRYYANDYRFGRDYPNAAHTSYFAERLLDRVTSVLTGMGIVFVLLFLLML